jgi:hypothetical protein
MQGFANPVPMTTRQARQRDRKLSIRLIRERDDEVFCAACRLNVTGIFFRGSLKKVHTKVHTLAVPV